MAHNQPTFDLLTGSEISPRHPLRETFKQSAITVAKADVNNEALRSQLHTLQYELDSLKQERDLTALHHQNELRDVQARAEVDYKRAQAAETARDAATKKADALSRDWQEREDRATNEKLALEKKLRTLQDDNRSLREEVEDAQAELSTQERQSKHAFTELEQKHATLQASVEGIQQDLVGKASALQSTQQKLAQRESTVSELENEILKLRAQNGDSDTLGVIKKELSEQVTYIRKLETTNRSQAAEVKQFKKTQKSIDLVEEEKHALEAKLKMMEDLRTELSEARLQKRILEDEKRGWTSYLESAAAGEEDMKFQTPEQMARAFLQERLERLSMVDRLGTMQPELSVKIEEIENLQGERSRLQREVESLRSSGAAPGAAGAGNESKIRARLERQKNLMSKEVDYLRAQMKTFEAEEAEFNPEQVNEEQMKRVHDLEDMVEQYRVEVESLHRDMVKAEAQPTPSSPKKRSREDDENTDERLGEMRRKTRKLQDDLTKLQTQNHNLAAELQASQHEISCLQESSRTRILELRANPTAEAEAVKLSTLRTLREENTALLSQLENPSLPATTKVVPISTLASLRLQLAEKDSLLATTEKKTLRLKQIWSSKSLEFREAVCSVLGWRLDFMPNGRVKATSILYPSSINPADGEEEENSIVFDGENGTMKVSGGPKSTFAGEIKELIEFWVEGRKEIPCFLAACTLEFYERSTRAAAA